jgi:hypothetical protein
LEVVLLSNEPLFTSSTTLPTFCPKKRRKKKEGQKKKRTQDFICRNKIERCT